MAKYSLVKVTILRKGLCQVIAPALGGCHSGRGSGGEQGVDFYRDTMSPSPGPLRCPTDRAELSVISGG